MSAKRTPGNGRLYYHKTSGGAEYLTDKFIRCPNGHREGIFKGATIIVRIDGELAKDAEYTLDAPYHAAPAMLEALQYALGYAQSDIDNDRDSAQARKLVDMCSALIARAEGRAE